MSSEKDQDGHSKNADPLLGHQTLDQVFTLKKGGALQIKRPYDENMAHEESDYSPLTPQTLYLKAANDLQVGGGHIPLIQDGLSNFWK